METLAATVTGGLVESIIVIDPTDQATIDHFGAIVLPQGSPVAIGWTYDGVIFAAPPLTLSDAQTTQLALMDVSYQAAVGAPIAYMATMFQADASSQTTIAAVLTACGGSLPAGFTWYDVNNVAVPVTFAQLQGMAATILMRGQPLFIHCQTQKAAIRAAATVADVQAIIF